MLTPRLELLRATVSHLEAMIEGLEVFEARFGMAVEEGYLEYPGALEYALEQLREVPQEAFWWEPRMILLRGTPTVIGLSRYKGPPDAAGRVEIGYGIAPAYEGHGYATETAAALVERAFQYPAVQAVRAHTLAAPNASSRILRKCGFQRIDELFDESEGRIWRWEKRRLAR